jgi:hypothetical protein
MISLRHIEMLLDAGCPAVQVGNGRWWRARRNGQAKRWKRDPDRFRKDKRVLWAIATNMLINDAGRVALGQ